MVYSELDLFSDAGAAPAVKRVRGLPVYRVEVVRDRTIQGAPAEAQTVAQVVPLLLDELQNLDRERLLCLMLNARHHLMGLEVISIGTLTASLAHPREIFKAAILKSAAGIILAHNHPSGDPSPSDEDRRLTTRVAQAGRILGIELLDHVIIGEGRHYSFKTSGVL